VIYLAEQIAVAVALHLAILSEAQRENALAAARLRPED
jgi:hypothetical protein